ncbi:hypothetical protein TELCIR_21970 [Teladorsagia circumcincta]|uniref:Uncharacterized protein n=1 Tax=Teladorsagia circumcincta TaxID=45464 RepID=A0A2G9TH08_TELCI|nr:hypothetical protein TELCIR_21970 [Teladorsagia circumcincta]
MLAQVNGSQAVVIVRVISKKVIAEVLTRATDVPVSQTATANALGEELERRLHKVVHRKGVGNRKNHVFNLDIRWCFVS